MTLSDRLSQLPLPIICAPMFLVSTPKLVIECCKSGVVGSFPALNVRPQEKLDEWITDIKSALDEFKTSNPEQVVAPFAVNQVVHPSNSRLAADQAIIAKHQVPLVITSQGNPSDIVEQVHSWGGQVFHDVIKVSHAKKAISAGVDGLILVTAGAGGHGGTLNPFAFVREVRSFWDGPIILAGGINDGFGIKAAQSLGADMVYMGTRFIATQEAQVDQDYKNMLIKCAIEDIVFSDHFTGVHANYLIPSLERVGINVQDLISKGKVDLDLGNTNFWTDIWSAGHGVGGINDIPSIQELTNKLLADYKTAAML
ncbi:nitronate monooxygenase [Bermanella marisrubri]|uniref:2-nitropropane dioxygenase, NPD n=1 Tax=Bermanella marisrubri TaxID=207949 RepID=Q1N6L6_9GAMM|nr:nitronate monooxygenase [Bermanella marisrubri]EAT13576.1 2-nitropropane dioxygenase, NPD [Oceanobacter sp. RED65] [Bermanella marisrubri]QIZ84367.1 nitronate monooxygenase [Bermanella marisrubri]